MKKGFSFLELIIVLIIVVVVTTLALPSYMKYTEKTRGKSAEANLMSIYNMEKRFKLDNGVYYQCASACTASFICPNPIGCGANNNIINRDLSLFIRDPYFRYSIAINGASGYTVTATRLANSGPCSGSTMTMTDSSSVVTKNCAAW